MIAEALQRHDEPLQPFAQRSHLKTMNASGDAGSREKRRAAMTATGKLAVARNAICCALAALTVSAWMTFGVISANAALSRADRAEVIVEFA